MPAPWETQQAMGAGATEIVESARVEKTSKITEFHLLYP